MPRYYFHLMDHSERLLDPEGRLLACGDEIPAAALREARAIISQDALTGVIDLSQRIEVLDDAGKGLHTLYLRDAVHIVSRDS